MEATNDGTVTTKEALPETKPPEEMNEKDTFVQKLLNEKKNAMEAKRIVEEENKKLKEERMREKEDLKGLLELREQEIVSLKADSEKKEGLIRDSLKAGAIKKELLKMGLDEKYLDQSLKLVDVNSLNYDSETRVVTGAEVQAKLLFEKVPVFFGKTNVGVNQSSPVGGTGNLTLQEWQKLPLDQMKLRKAELMDSLGFKTTKV